MEAIETFGQSHAWLAQFLSLPNGIPSHDTFRRLFAPRPYSVSAVLPHWVNALTQALERR